MNNNTNSNNNPVVGPRCRGNPATPLISTTEQQLAAAAGIPSKGGSKRTRFNSHSMKAIEEAWLKASSASPPLEVGARRSSGGKTKPTL